MQKLESKKQNVHIYETLFFICCLSVCLFSANELYIITWVAYALFLGISCLIMILRKQTKFVLNHELVVWTLFVVYSIISALWAKYSSSQFGVLFFLVQMLVFLIVAYEMFRRNANAGLRLMMIIIAVGTILSIYTPIKYGVFEYIDAMQGGARMGAEVMGENSMGTFTSMATILAFAVYVFYKKRSFLIFMVLNAFACLSTGSRMSFVSMAFGILLIIFFNTCFKSIDIAKALVKFFLVAVFTLGVIFLIIKYVPAFATIYKRVEGLLRVLVGDSANTEGFGQNGIRNILVRVGLMEFFNHPILGIGYNNSRNAAAIVTGTQYILHNNFVEVLCNGGIIGFILHYMFYVSLLCKHIKLLKTKSPAVAMSLTLIIVNLLQQVAGVMYVEKYFYFIMIVWIIVGNRKEEYYVQTTKSADGGVQI